MRIKRQLMSSIVVVVAAFLVLTDTTSADSFGSWGGSWGSGSSGSRLFGGSNGGPIRNLLARAPLRTALGNARNHLGGWGSSGGSYGGGSSGGYLRTGGYASTGGGSVGSYVGGGSSGGGSWGSSYSYGSTGGGSWGSVSNYGSAGSYPVSTVSTPMISAPMMSAPISTAIPSVGYDSFGTIGQPMETSFGTPLMGTEMGTLGDPVIQGGMGEVVDPNYYNGTAPGGDMIIGGDVMGGGVIGGVNDGSSVIEGGMPPSPGGALSPPADGGAGGVEPTPGPSDNDTTQSQRLKESLIDVSLPADAVVYVNGKRTSKTGEHRTFVARHQKPKSKYRYEITVVKDGKEKVQTFTMLAGGSKSLSFDFDTMTTVAVQVPENATVELAGNMTNGNGAIRKFTTKKLEEGEAWDDYKVVVTYEQDGETVVREKTINVVGGNAYTLDFASSLDSTAVAVKKP